MSSIEAIAEYIKKWEAEGYDFESIKKTLLEYGYKESDIEKAANIVSNGNSFISYDLDYASQSEKTLNIIPIIIAGIAGGFVFLLGRVLFLFAFSPVRSTSLSIVYLLFLSAFLSLESIVYVAFNLISSIASAFLITKNNLILPKRGVFINVFAISFLLIMLFSVLYKAFAVKFSVFFITTEIISSIIGALAIAFIISKLAKT